MIEKASRLINKKFGKRYTDASHHNMDAYLKSDCQKIVEDLFHAEILPTISNHLRNQNDIQRIIFSYYALAVNRGYLKYVGRNESGRIRVHKSNFKQYIVRYSPNLCCVNDNEHAKETDRRLISPFLEELFPQKSSFEK